MAATKPTTEPTTKPTTKAPTKATTKPTATPTPAAATTAATPATPANAGQATTRFHLSLNVRSLDRSVAFYRDLLGVEPDKRRDGFARFTLDAPPLVLSLIENRPAADAQGPQRLSHLGFRVGSEADLDAARRRLDAAGHALREEPESRCCYALQRKFWVTDPDGNEWEFYQLLDDLETRGDETSDCCA